MAGPGAGWVRVGGEWDVRVSVEGGGGGAALMVTNLHAR